MCSEKIDFQISVRFRLVIISVSVRATNVWPYSEFGNDLSYRSTLGPIYNEHRLQQELFFDIKLIDSLLGWRFVQL